jgi:hypothetical protein
MAQEEAISRLSILLPNQCTISRIYSVIHIPKEFDKWEEMKVLRDLTELEFLVVHIEDPSALRILTYCTQIPNLSVKASAPLDGSDLFRRIDRRRLRSLTLMDVKLDDTVQLQSLQGLESLKLFFQPLSEEQIASVATLPKLKELMFKTDGEIHMLSKLNRLEHLDLGLDRSLRDTDLNVLESLHGLRSLDLSAFWGERLDCLPFFKLNIARFSGIRFTNRGLDELSRLPLESLEFTRASRRYVKHVGKIRTLKRLTLGWLELDQQCVQDLVGLDALTYLECGHIVPSAIPLLRQFPSLTGVRVTCDISKAEYDSYKELSDGRIEIDALNASFASLLMPDHWRPETRRSTWRVESYDD